MRPVLSHKLRARRSALGLVQQQLSDWERGRCVPNVATAIRLVPEARDGFCRCLSDNECAIVHKGMCANLCGLPHII